jgi:hypothetical protein
MERIAQQDLFLKMKGPEYWNGKEVSLVGVLKVRHFKNGYQCYVDRADTDGTPLVQLCLSNKDIDELFPAGHSLVGGNWAYVFPTEVTGTVVYEQEEPTLQGVKSVKIAFDVKVDVLNRTSNDPGLAWARQHIVAG